MLSKPNVLDLMPKIGNRYEVVMAISKRAREIAVERIENEDKDIEDTVDVASREFDEGIVILDEKNNFNTNDYVDTEQLEVQASKDDEISDDNSGDELDLEEKKKIKRTTKKSTSSSKAKVIKTVKKSNKE